MDPLDAAAEFNAAYGVARVDLADRAATVSILTQRSAVLADGAKQLLGALWRLITDIEAGASDEVALAGWEDAGVVFAHMVLELYGDAAVLGLDKFGEIVERAHRARMSAVGGSYKRAKVTGLVTLPTG